MQIGIIGAGRVATAFAKYLLAAGHTVLISNSRGPETLQDAVRNLGTGASAATIKDAAAAPIVALAVPWLKVEAALSGLPAWNSRILIDATNQFIGNGGQLAELDGRISSQYIADFAPGARVVKALNNLIVENFLNGPTVGGGKRITFISGDDDDAKKQVGDLLESFGFAVIDLGPLQRGGLMQQAGGPLAGPDLVKM